MCGIAAVLGVNTATENVKSELRYRLHYRGPDIQNEITTIVPQHESSSGADASDGSPLWLCGSVLHIQGEDPAVQPTIDLNGMKKMSYNSYNSLRSMLSKLYPELHRECAIVEWRSIWL